jgi:hypothetical protein
VWNTITKYYLTYPVSSFASFLCCYVVGLLFQSSNVCHNTDTTSLTRGLISLQRLSLLGIEHDYRCTLSDGSI